MTRRSASLTKLHVLEFQIRFREPSNVKFMYAVASNERLKFRKIVIPHCSNPSDTLRNID